MRPLEPTSGAACIKSRLFPCGMPSTISSSTTSYRPVSTRRCAVVPPTLPAPMTVIFSRPTGFPSNLVVLVRGPAGHLKIDRTHEILAQIEVELDFFLSVVLRQELLRILDQFLVRARLVLPQLDEADDHPGLDLLQDLEPALRVDFPELSLDLIGCGLRPVFSGRDSLRELRLATHVRVGMPGEQFVEPLRDLPLAGIRIHQVVN